MKPPHFILIADRNPNICRYLTRELRGDGHRLFAVRTFAQLRHWVERQHPMDLLVLDPTLSEEDALANLPTLWAHIRALPLIIHCLPGDCPAVYRQHPRAIIVEKSGNSVTGLKQGIRQLLETRRCQPHQDSQRSAQSRRGDC
jgi:DNA-binding NtrC family response regulator